MTTQHIFSQRARDQRTGRAGLARMRGRAGTTIVLVVVALELITVAGCGTTSGSSSGTGTGNGSQPTGTTPVAKSIGQVTEFPLPTPGSVDGDGAITAGPDGNLWFTECLSQGAGYCNGSTIGRITPDGKITEFPIPTSQAGVTGITAGPDGNLWFTECDTTTGGSGCSSSEIGRITPAGQVTEYPLATANSAPTGITVGTDKNLWFTAENSNQIGQITSGK